jgi:hypothetical protein
MSDASAETVTNIRENCHEALVSVALVQEDGFADLGCELQLRRESSLLCVARREIAKEVETAFADCHDSRLVVQRAQGRAAVRVELFGVVGVHARRGEQPPRLRSRQRRTLNAGRDRRAGHDEPMDARGRGAFDHAFSIAIEAVMGQIDADIYELEHAGSRQ